MSSRSPRRYLAIGLISLLLAAVPAIASANHSWNGYHWARTSNPFNLKLGDNVSSAWDAYLGKASSDWSKSTVLDTTIVAGKAKPSNCRPTAGRDEICNATYGSTGWLGVAQIWASGTHITQGTVKLNDTYFNTATYNTPAWRQFVTCQEVGHTFGLAHQNENFSDPNLGSCMDYTNDPDGTINNQLSNLDPNQHDYDELATIYAHLDSTTTVGSAPSRSPALDGSNWGRRVSASKDGRSSTYLQTDQRGNAVITFVIWAR